MLDSWSKNLTWVRNKPNLLIQKTYKVDQSVIRLNIIEVVTTIEDKTILVNGKAEPLALTNRFNTGKYNHTTNDIPQSEIDRMKQELENFTSKVIKIRETQLLNWKQAVCKIETTDPLSMQ